MILVTGCAGFIGSHLTERLLSNGHKVIGVDSFSDYYPRDTKEENMRNFIRNKDFKFIEGDITEIALDDIMKDVNVVFHQAGQGGVIDSWGKNFEIYIKNNIISTQKLLEACKGKKVKKFVYASSSSIYGDAEKYPTAEETLPKPFSPYGVTKLAAENLCHLYFKNFGVPTISLRYFSVYGPRQRPDMAFHKFIRGIMQGHSLQVYGDGEQKREFTYVSDIVNANILAMQSSVSGEVFNIGGGSMVSVNESIKLLEHITGKTAKIEYIKTQKGDVRNTGADITKALKVLGYKPKIGIKEGLKNEIEWIKGLS